MYTIQAATGGVDAANGGSAPDSPNLQVAGISGGSGISGAPGSAPESCGDGAIDQGEECDDGEENSDTKEGGCSTRCSLNECESESTRNCAASGALGNCAAGLQLCADGAWGPCSVEAASADTCMPNDDANCNGTANEGCDCVAGTHRSCAAGGALGNCAAGEQECLEDGTYGPCSITPKSTDSCSSPNDDANCDGTPNGGCPCVDGKETPCGPPDPKGSCKSGISRCVNSVWSQCDAIFPKARDCTSSRDDDCDGLPDNTVDAVCACAPNSERACNEHAGKDGKGPCKAGRQQCRLAADQASSTWSACTGAVGPAASDSCAIRGNDANCDGVPNGDCTCVSGDTTTCGAKYGSPGDCAAYTLSCTTSGTWPTSSACIKSEVCDGLDNDCDGLVDLADGLGLAGSAATIPSRAWADITWSTTAQNFGFVAQQNITSPRGIQSGIYFGNVSQSGQVSLRNGSVSTPESNETTYGRPRLAFSPIVAAYGVIYAISSPSLSYGRYSLLDDTGTLRDSRAVKSGGAITSRANGEFVIFQNPPTGWVLGLGQGPNYVELESNWIAPISVGIASNGNDVALLEGIEANNVLWNRHTWSSLDAWFEPGPDIQVSTAGRNPDGVGVPGGYAFAVASAAGARYMVADAPSFGWVCGATTLEFGNNVLDADDAVAVEQTAYGTLVLATDAGSGQVRLFRLGASCQILDQVEVRPNAVGSRAPSIAVGGGKVALSWTEVSGSTAQGYVRVVDERRLCQ